MKLIRNINNNVSLCLDSKGAECIVMGKGVGFTGNADEVPLSKIERTFYNVNPSYIGFIQSLDPALLEILCEVVDYANFQYDNLYSTGLVFSLADHIAFVLERRKSHISLELPLSYEVQHAYPQEMKLAETVLQMLKDELKTELPLEEAPAIALHFVNNRIGNTPKASSSLIEVCSRIVEAEMDIQIDRSGFSYARFITHLLYLIERKGQMQSSKTDNEKLFAAMVQTSPKVYSCALQIGEALHADLSQEELLYLMLHINRLCSREDCNRNKRA